MSIRLFFPLTLLAALLFSIAVQAQTPTPSAPINGAEQPAANGASPIADPEAWKRLLDSAEQAVAREGITDSDLDQLFDEAGKIRDAAAVRAKELTPLVNQAKQQIDQLGAAPADGEPPEAEEVSTRREQLNQAFSEVDARQKRARLTELRAQQLQRTISDLRNQRFVKSISKRAVGTSTAEFWSGFTGGFSGFWRGLQLLVTDSAKVFWEKLSMELRSQFLLATLLLLVGYLYFRLSRFLREIVIEPRLTSEPPGSDIPPSGFLYYLQNGVMPGILPYLIYRIVSGLNLLAPRMDQFLYTFVIAIGFGIAALTLFRVYLSPSDGTRRLMLLSDGAARRIYSIITVGLLVTIALVVLERITVVLVSPLVVSLGLSLFTALAVGGFTLGALIVARNDSRKLRRSGAATVDEAVAAKVGKRFWAYLVRLIWFLAVVILVAAAAGYIAFAEFLSEQLLFGLVVVLTTRLLLKFTDYALLLMPARLAEDREGEPPASSGSGQILILLAGLSKMSIYLVAAILMLLPWGYRTSDFFQFFRSVFFGFEIGGFSFSVSTILLAVVLFVVGYLITVALRNWLNNKFLPTTNLDIGISNSISTVFGYAGFILAAAFAITAAGFDLSNLAIVAGALTVGVGFGLQSIVNNFVSGLILLAERPIKAGDWVVTSGGQGYVKKISVRSTEIETFDRSTVIVPNSNLITETVENWTHDNKSGRIIVPVGVGYDSDPEQVREILLECAKAHKMVLGRPEPQVYFMDFGASSLDFQLRCFLGDINWALSVSSELRFAILKALREADIEIPYPQQDVHIKSGQYPGFSIEKPSK